MRAVYSVRAMYSVLHSVQCTVQCTLYLAVQSTEREVDGEALLEDDEDRLLDPLPAPRVHHWAGLDRKETSLSGCHSMDLLSLSVVVHPLSLSIVDFSCFWLVLVSCD